MGERPSNDLTGAAGVFFVAYRLSLRGLIVLPTIRNTAAIDLLVHDPATGRQAALQVKTSSEKVKFWPESKHEKCLKGMGTFHVFLRFDKAADSYEAFLEAGDRVAEQVKANADEYVASGKADFPYWELPRDPADVERLRQAWRTWRP